MDKGGDEHLVALQRLEEALNAVNEHAPVAGDLIPNRLGPFHRDRLFRDYLRKVQPLLHQIQTFQPYWPGLDRELLNDLTKAVKELNERLVAFIDLQAQEQKFAAIIVYVSTFTFDNRLVVISRARNELDSLRVRSIFCPASATGEISIDPTIDSAKSLDPQIIPDTERLLQLSSELEAHAVSLQEGWRYHRVLKDIYTFLYGIVGPVSLVLFIIAMINGEFASESTFDLIIRSVIFLHLFLTSLLASQKWWWQKNSVRARTRFLSAISEHIKRVRGDVTSAAIIDLIEFAARHRNDETEYKTFDLKTEELKSLIADTPPSGPTATATQ